MDKKIQKKKRMKELEQARRPIPEGPERFRVRCIDGRYYLLFQIENVPLGAVAGADPGRMVGTVATLRRLNVSYQLGSLFQAQAELVGGEEYLTYHDLEENGCGHIKKVRQHPTVFGVTAGEVEFIIERFINSSAQKFELPGEHTESEVIVTVGGGVTPINKFTFTEDLVREGEQRLAEILVEKGYVRLASSMSVGDLGNELFKTIEEHFQLIGKMLASGKGLYRADLRLPQVEAVLLGIL